MSDTTVELPVGVADGVAAYVREVRAELADLPVEDVDDLVGGMEADLTEFATESGGELASRLGPPGLYADELRAAAGLPERGVGTGKKQRRPLRQAAAGVRGRYTTLTERHSWLRPVNAFLVSVRPAWWVLRGYLAAWAVWWMTGGTGDVRVRSIVDGILALAAIVISVQVGRGWLRQWGALRPLLIIANGIALILVVAASVSTEVSSYEAGYYSPPSGVSVDGQPLANIYAYSSEGERISGVRLFDQNGRPLVGDTVFDADGNPVAGVRDGSGASVFNVYPRARKGPDPWQVTDPTNLAVDPDLWTPPVSIVPLTPGATSTGTPTSMPSATTTAPSGAATSKPAPPKAGSPTSTAKPVPSVTRSVR